MIHDLCCIYLSRGALAPAQPDMLSLSDNLSLRATSAARPCETVERASEGALGLQGGVKRGSAARMHGLEVCGGILRARGIFRGLWTPQNASMGAVSRLSRERG
jgi:hypothetical protein